jgi:hypothetical protein
MQQGTSVQNQGQLYYKSAEKLRQRLGTADELQIRLLLNVPPAQRLRIMLGLQNTILNMWRYRLHKAHPDLNDLELSRLIFDRLKQNG